MPPTAKPPACKDEGRRTKVEGPKPVNVAELVDEGAQIDAVLADVKPLMARLDEIKALLRAAADGAEMSFTSPGGAIAVVKPVADSTVRAVPDELRPKVRELCGRALDKLFNFAPVKDFELTCFKTLAKDAATQLVKLLKTPSSSRVTFSFSTAKGPTPDGRMKGAKV